MEVHHALYLLDGAGDDALRSFPHGGEGGLYCAEDLLHSRFRRIESGRNRALDAFDGLGHGSRNPAPDFLDDASDSGEDRARYALDRVPCGRNPGLDGIRRVDGCLFDVLPQLDPELPEAFIGIPQVGIVKGDAKSISIAAASIVAKVYRDRLMTEYDALYPEYKFAKNKGYGTKEHMQALHEIGMSPIHRKSFVHI